MAAKIYHVHPLVAGPVAAWAGLFQRVQAMGFSHACIAPVFAPAPDGDIFVTADHERLHPALNWDGTADAGIAEITAMADRHGLRLMLDLVLHQVAADAAIRRRFPDWFATGFSDGPPDPRRTPARPDAAAARLGATETAEGLTEWWSDRIVRLLRAGVAGFRCLEPGRVPPVVWRRLFEPLRDTAPDSLLLAWTPGTDRAALPRLRGAGFDLVAGSQAWWDGRAPWLVEEMAVLRDIAPAIASPEPSFTDRLTARLATSTAIPGAYRHALHVAAATGAGLFVPMGFEFATRRPFDVARATPDDMARAEAEAPCDLSEDVAEANDLIDQVAAQGVNGAIRQLTASSAAATALLRYDAADPRESARAALLLINPDIAAPAPLPIRLAPLPPEAGAAFALAEPLDSPADPALPLAPGEVRILAYERTPDITGVHDAPLEPAAVTATRIAIEAIEPSVPDGDYAAKRVVGEAVTVSADIVTDGHEVLAAALLWRAADDSSWRRVPMHLVNNDRWAASFSPSRIGPHVFTIEAWWDVWGTFRHDLHAKHAAGLPVILEIEEGRRMLDAAAQRAAGLQRDALAALLARLRPDNEAAAVDILLSDAALAAMQAVDPQDFLVRHAPPLRLEVDRPQAIFASWYELFPRSVTHDPARHGTFDDVIGRLPAIRAMGFDVLYFPPIHPIGHTNRKGRNNALRAEPGDVGSPYAIGSEEGGHDAVHPQLGTLEDFRRLVAAAKANELEIALDFAIQCSPDHPWLKQHPDWFRWRPDGSLRYAENPPKKYEDIVNPDFYAPAAMPGLWYALRDVVQFWTDQGVRIFRVDNPHTKPLPFWRWMIADIRDRHPDVLFLAEAFTRPKVMHRLAKVGFSQSYTYFTWRETKAELTEYLTELTTPPVADFFRPNFFVNTPDINPVFLQTSGRAGFLLRAALATMLSGLWGMYSGFEICESAPLPGREEYLDSEKYEIRVRDFDARGNIVNEIAALNRIRRAHPALQTHLGVQFIPVFNDNILLFGKRAPRALADGGSAGLASDTPDEREMILVAVNLDPHHVQEADFELPLWQFGQPDNGALDAADLMRGHRFTWYGKIQHIRLDPADLPFAIWQVTLPRSTEMNVALARPRPAQAAVIEDRLWYKDAIIYQLHIKSFFDSNNDGIGDFPGLISKLDYIAELGVSAIWLLPFYPSPLLDDGYDIADYRGVHPDYGTLHDVKRFIHAAHQRGIRVITELVVNHTSQQHPWFQRARLAKPGSVYRDFYVWSDSDQKYPGTRVIFVDTERSNWTWDPVANAYYWHRFYAHQPDLNFDNPRVLREVLAVLRFWADLGVDGLRLDAVPYLVEREGTNNENLPETHAVLKQIRAELDAHYPDRMLLAEANQWPEDTKEYFGEGDGDECHMAFHFPLMPRMYMAIAREDRFPITDIMRQTPEIPATAQWAIFLRNHDELTLEMVTQSERDFLWETYAADRRARINLGIRRRLSPLMEHDRRRIELMNHLLLTMPGTPVIYYGDEIGMGDNVYLGDRNGVRTPMQWSPDRNGGFSRADPSRLTSPPIMDAVYGYEAVNVEAQASDPHSLLMWMRRNIAVRRQYQAFGRGTFRVLYPKNRKILAYLREHEGVTILCVANLARTPQAVELDLSEFNGRIPIELDGGSIFPPIGQLTYLLTLAPYGFYWFNLAEETAWPTLHTPAPEPMPEYQTIIMRKSFAEGLLAARGVLEREVLPPYLAKRRWFAQKDQKLNAVRIALCTSQPQGEMALVEIETDTAGGTARWLLPLGICWEDGPTPALASQLALARVRHGARVGLLTDAFALPALARGVMTGLAQSRVVETDAGTIRFEPTSRMRDISVPPDVELNWLSAEQSNSSLIVGDVAMVKMFRRVSSGQHPEAEMGRYLTEQGFANTPALLGEVVRIEPDGARHALVIAQCFIRNQGDAWSWTLDLLMRGLSDLAGGDEAAAGDAERHEDYDAIASLLGRRLGEMHAILARPSDNPDFAPEAAGPDITRAWAAQAEQQLAVAFTALGARKDWPEEAAQDLGRVMAVRDRLAAAARDLAARGVGSPVTRIHGDLHLGQVLVANGDVFIIDFEGEPAKPLAQRRAKNSPYRDVAGMLRSFDYAAAVVDSKSRESHAHLPSSRRTAFLESFVAQATASFLGGYRNARGVADSPADQALLDLFLLEKAAYEVAYEAANRPTWIDVPLRGLARLADSLLRTEAAT